MAGAQATQAAIQTGQGATSAAAAAGTSSTFVLGGVALSGACCSAPALIGAARR